MATIRDIIDAFSGQPPLALSLDDHFRARFPHVSSAVRDFLIWLRVGSMTVTIREKSVSPTSDWVVFRGSATVLGVAVDEVEITFAKLGKRIALQFRVPAMNLPVARLVGVDAPDNQQDDFLPADYRDLVGGFVDGGLPDALVVPGLELVYDSHGEESGGNEIYFACVDLGVRFAPASFPVALEHMGFELRRGLDSNGGWMALHGTLTVGRGENVFAIVASIEVPFADTIPRAWRLQLRRPIDLPQAFSSLVSLLENWSGADTSAVRSIAPSLPDALRGLPGFLLSDFELFFSPAKATVDYLSFRVETARPWQIIDGLTITQLGLSGQFMGMRDLRLEFFGSLMVSDVLAVTASVNLPVGDSSRDWFFSSRGEFRPAGGLGKALALPMFTGKAPPVASADLPAGFLDIQGFSLGNLQLTFNPFTPSLSSFAFTVRLDGGIGPRNIVTLHNPYLSLEVDDPFGQRKVGGEIGVTVKLGAIAFDLRASRTPDEAGSGIWTFTANRVGAPQPIADLFEGARQELNLPCVVPDYFQQVILKDLWVEAIYATDRKLFEVEGQLSAPIAGTVVEASLRLACDGGAIALEGDLYLGGQRFSAAYESKTFAARWTADPGEALKITDIARQFGMTEADLSMIPSDIDLGFAGAGASYDAHAEANALVADASLTLPKLDAVLGVLAAKPQAATAATLAFAAKLKPKGFAVNLGELPLVGEALQGWSIGLSHISLLLSPKLAEPDLLRRLAGVIPDLTGRTDLAGGLTLVAEIALGSGRSTSLSFNVGGPSRQPAPVRLLGAGLDLSDPAPTPAIPGLGAKWIALGKSLGPVTIHRLGLGWKQGRLHVLLDGEASLGPLSVRLIGVGVSSPLGEFKPQPQLSGIGLGFETPSLTLRALLMSIDPDAVPALKQAGVTQALGGELVVKAGTVQLVGVGLYGRIGDDPWLFFYADVQVPIGGPPFFFMTGLCGGFGFNSMMTLPTPSTLDRFPLLADMGKGSSGDSMLMSLIDEGWITASRGEGWIAAGIHFTTFKVLDCMAMVVANVGHSLEFSLLGRASVSLPPESPRVMARINLLVQAAFKPNEGTLYLAAAIGAGSFLLDESCRLYGNAGFQTWFSGPHTGDFVLSLGGYHPSYKVPAHYPRLPRLGFSWRYSDAVSMTGGLYFAMTPACAMAGGRFEVTYQSGRVRAWLTAYGDAYMDWAPFYFTIDAGVRAGVSLDTWLGTLSTTVGATLHLAGPKVGGHVTVDVWFVSVTIRIGEPDARPAATWSDVRKNLPAGDLAKISVQGGLIGRQGRGAEEIWVVDPEIFSFTTECAVPATSLGLNGQTLFNAGEGQDFRVRPLRTGPVTAPHTVEIHRLDAQGAVQSLENIAWETAAQSRTVPGGLWGEAAMPLDQPDRALMPNRLAGMKISVPPSRLAESRYMVGGRVLAYEPAATTSSHGDAAPDWQLSSSLTYVPAPVQADDSLAVVANSLAATEPRRQSILFALGQAGLAPSNVSAALNGLVGDGQTALIHGPLLAA